METNEIIKVIQKIITVNNYCMNKVEHVGKGLVISLQEENEALESAIEIIKKSSK